jgi:hypothetical protein
VVTVINSTFNGNSSTLGGVEPSPCSAARSTSTIARSRATRR